MEKNILVFLILFLATANSGYCDTYYCIDTGGSDGWGVSSNSNNGESKSTPWKTIGHGVTNIATNDTLVIGDGTYTGSSNMISPTVSPPEGTEGSYTIVMAENTGEVIIDGGGTLTPIYITGNDTVGGNTGTNSSHDYIEIKGVIVTGSATGGIEAEYVNHLKIIDCGSYEALGVYSPISIYRSTYILVEGCYAWGSARYTLKFNDVRYGIFRNCVGRLDRSNSGEPIGVFGLYGTQNCEVQNCIVIDSDQPDYVLNYEQDQGCFGNPGTSSRVGSGPNNYTNCIAVNNTLSFGSADWGLYKNEIHTTNCIGWALEMPQTRKKPTELTYPWIFYSGRADTYFTNCTFGDITNFDDSISEIENWSTLDGVSAQQPDTNTNECINTIFYSIYTGAGIFRDYETSNNNIVNGMTADRDIDIGSTSSTNTKTYDPTSNGLTYLTRINTSSQLETDGIGATIEYQYGKTGTLWGDDDYKLLQDGTTQEGRVQATTPLWPFPNEDIIKTKMAAYEYDDGGGGDPEIEGDRGFCADTANPRTDTGKITLTSYIWEYLGNTDATAALYDLDAPPTMAGITSSGMVKN